VARTDLHLGSAKTFAGASILNSLLLPIAAALHFNVSFWVLGVTNFVLFHAIWLHQLVRLRGWSRVDWGWSIYRWPLALVAFAVAGNLSYILWEAELTSVFPS